MHWLKHDNSSPVWRLRELDCARRQAAERLFADKPLQKPAQHFLLFTIERCVDAGVAPTQGELAQKMQLSPATMTASLRYLEKLGLIRRQQDAEDQRKNRVMITDAGRQAAAACRESMDMLSLSMFCGFTEEELDSLSGFFSRMIKNLKDIHEKERKP